MCGIFRAERADHTESLVLGAPQYLSDGQRMFTMCVFNGEKDGKYEEEEEKEEARLVCIDVMHS